MKCIPRRGFALSLTLYVVFAVLLAGMTLATLATFNIHLSKDSRLRDEAFDAANSGLSFAIFQLTKNPKWGTHPGDALPVTSLAPSDVPVGPSMVSMSPSDPSSFSLTFSAGGVSSLPWSVNNLANPAAVPGPTDYSGAARTVPPYSALLFVQGTAGSSGNQRVRVIEALVQFPPCLFAIAASNAVASWNNNQFGNGLGGFRTCCGCNGAFRTRVDAFTGVGGCGLGGSVFAGGAVHEGYCNTTCSSKNGGTGCRFGLSASYSVYLAPYSTVTGDVVMTGGTNVVVGCPCKPVPNPVASATESASQGETVPVINITSFDNKTTASTKIPFGTTPPDSFAGTVYIDAGGPAVPPPGGGPPPPGTAVSLGSQGNPVSLNNVTMYVNGDLNLPGGVTGPGGCASGSIFVNGAVNLSLPQQTTSMATLASTNGIAIFAQHDLTVASLGAAGSVNLAAGAPLLFGTLYSHGNVNLNKGIHVVGSVIAAADTASNVFTSTTGSGNVFLESGVEVTYFPQYSQFGSLWATTTPAQPNTQNPAQLMKICYWREVQ